MGIRDDEIDLRLLVRRLVKIRPSLKQEPDEVQRGIAEILLHSQQKQKQHKSEDGQIVITHQEIYEKVTKGQEGFQILTTRHSLMSSPVSDEHPYGYFSTKREQARAFMVSPDVASELASYFAGWPYRQHRRKRLETKRGKPVKLNAAIASKDASGADATAQGKDLVANYVAIDVDGIKDYIKQLKRTRANAENYGQRDMFTGSDMAEVDQIIDRVGRMMESTMIYEGQTVLLHRYIQSDMGRLYAQGINLQNIQKEIRNIVLMGFWDYDIEACHHTILYQLAGSYELDLPAVGHYLANKDQVREQIAKDVGITVKQAKACITMQIYGAYQSKRDPVDYKDAIPGLIGLDKAEALYQHPLWQGLQKDLPKGRAMILKRWPDRRLDKKRGKVKLVNAMGLPIEAHADPKKVLAHLLQGIEAKMLEVVRLLYPNTLELMMHDGFVSKTRFDVERLEVAILEATGFAVSFGEPDLIQPSAHMGIRS